MYWVDDAKELEQVGDFGAATRDGCWGEGVDPRVVLSDTRVLDVLRRRTATGTAGTSCLAGLDRGASADGGAWIGALGRGGGRRLERKRERWRPRKRERKGER